MKATRAAGPALQQDAVSSRLHHVCSSLFEGCIGTNDGYHTGWDRREVPASPSDAGPAERCETRVAPPPHVSTQTQELATRREKCQPNSARFLLLRPAR